MSFREDNKQKILKEYMTNLDIQVQIASYIRCPRSWCDTNFIPDYHRFYYILDGEGLLKIGDREFYPQPGELYWLPAGIKQSYATISDNTFLKYWCHFKTSINHFDILRFLDFPFYIKIDNEEKRMEKLFQQLVKYYDNNNFISTLQCKATLLQIISLYLKKSPAHQIKLKRTEEFNKISLVLEYIDNNISRYISLEELAGILHYHPNYVGKFFKTHLGKSPITYINQLRVDKAKQLLSTSKLDVKDIAYEVGFNNISYFSRYFKKETGLSPSEYREKSIG